VQISRIGLKFDISVKAELKFELDNLDLHMYLVPDDDLCVK